MHAEFISVLAHELKAPLGAIEGYLRMLRDHSAGDDPAVYDQMIDRSLIRLEAMRKLITDLLDMTRIELGTRKRKMAEMDARDVARAAIETMSAEAAAANVTLCLATPDPQPMIADRGEIEFILNNLISNAVKYNRPDGRADVKITGDAQTVTIQVTDTGIGLAPQDADRLFHDFVRIKNEQTRSILGSGLGLSIVRKLAALYGGSATVASQQGVGSTFTVTLRRRNEK